MNFIKILSIQIILSSAFGLYAQSSFDFNQNHQIIPVNNLNQKFPHAAFDLNGMLHLTWVEQSGSNLNVYYAQSSDGGSSFSEAVRINTHDHTVVAYIQAGPKIAIRGDETNYQKPMANNRTANVYAEDLVLQIGELRKGNYLEPVNNAAKLDFCVGVGAYPEKHFEAPNLKTDIYYLKRKVEAGAEYVVTQMFFDTDKYLGFSRACKKESIDVPIVPGLKLLTRVKQLTTIPKNFYVDLPDDLVDEVMEKPEHVEEIGHNWAFKQCEQLLNNGVKYLHFYIMNDASGVLKLVDKLNKY